MRKSPVFVVFTLAVFLSACGQGPKGDQGQPGPQGAKGEQGRTGLHVVRLDSCQSSNCSLACDAGESLGSITCPQGEVSITKSGDTETASCSNSPGPALAL